MSMEKDHGVSRLVARFRQGDAGALAALFDLYVDRVYGYALHILERREDAEEVASDAFLRAFRRAADYRGDCPFAAWLFTITRNLCRDRLRQPRLPMLPELGDEAVDTDEPERARIRVDVRKALAALPEDYRDVLILCDVQEWDIREAAEVLDRTPAAAKSLLYRARRALRDSLAESWGEE